MMSIVADHLGNRQPLQSQPMQKPLSYIKQW
jgi:hypothetical protein